MSGNRPGEPDLRNPENIREEVIERGPGEGTLEPVIPPLSEEPIPPLPGGEPGVATNVPSRTPWEVLWIKLRKNKAAMMGLSVLILLYATIPIAGFLAPYHYATQNQHYAFHPPMIWSIRVRDEQGNFRRPFVYGSSIVSPTLKIYAEDTSRIYPITFFAQGDEYELLWVIPTTTHLIGVDASADLATTTPAAPGQPALSEAPTRLFLFGSDLFGRDILSRILYGARISLSVGIIGILISTVIGMLVGGVSGYFGGTIDFVSMRLVELILAVPGLYLILVLRQAFGTNISSTYLYFLIIIILSFIGWASQARVIRGMVLSLKEQEYVVAAQALGFSRFWIVIKHILPNTLSFVIVTATLSVPFYILGEVSLSFLGVGIQEPEASWGNMLKDALNVRYLTDFWWILAPGVFIFIAVMAWNVFGDGLRDAADPRTQR